ncbi:MAG: tetratricopeptide repeat protein [Bacteroidetes bacterium]|nr:tetratricopeptide repeat protein [Bacteroidota bacterium]MBS1629567.1 tetratricopeptide repeat protein [Bacteroidota bacterium]
MNSCRKIFIAFILLCLSAPVVWGQRVPTSITRRDERNIKAQAEQTIGDLVNLLNMVSDPDNSVTDLQMAIDNAMTADSRLRIFFQDDFEADDDLDPNIPADEAMGKDIRAYLRQFRDFYKQNKALSIRYQITQVGDIHVGQLHLYLKVFFNQIMDGKDRKGNSFPSKIAKVAEMQVVTIGGQYKTLISHLDRQTKAGDYGNTPTVTISDAAESNADDGTNTPHSESYYRMQLAAGISLLGESNYTEAYYSLKEAKRFPATAGDAENRIQELMAKMRSRNIEPTESLYEGLSTKAAQLQDKYRYNLARNYLNYALEVRPSATKNAAANLQALSQLQAQQQLLLDLLSKGAYQEAQKGFSTALAKDKLNPMMHIGLARAYAQLGQSDQAESEFRVAIQMDPSYPEAYKWMGNYYLDKKEYRLALDALAGFQARTEDTGDVQVLSNLALCRGKLASAQNNIVQAAENFNAAIQYNPENTDALIAQADLLRLQGEKGIKAALKLIEDALKQDEKNAEAYAVRARIYESQANREAAAEAYQSAIKFDKDNPRWYYELGKLQMEIKDKTDNSAILNFTACMNIHGVTREDALIQVQALWKRGKCYYLQNRNEEAQEDYEAFRQKARLLPSQFSVDYANLLIKRARYDEALASLKLAGEKPESLLSLGILNYTRHPTDESSYADYFTRAFRDGVSQDDVRNAPNMQMVYENCSLVKSLFRKYKYRPDF